MRINKTRTLPGQKRKSPNKIVLGVAVMVATALVGVTGAANAAAQRDPNAPNPPSKAACKDGGWKHFGFKNQGLCVSWFNNHAASGYGGGSNAVSNNVNLVINGSHNVVNFVVNIFN